MYSPITDYLCNTKEENTCLKLKKKNNSQETINIPSLSEKNKTIGMIYESKPAASSGQFDLLCLL